MSPWRSYSFVDRRSGWLSRGSAGGPQGGNGNLEAFQLPELGVLVLDVHRHVGIDPAQRGQEPRPELDVVSAADRDEVPTGVLRPPVHGVPPTETRRVFAPRYPGEAVIEHAVDGARRVDPGVLRGGGQHP